MSYPPPPPPQQPPAQPPLRPDEERTWSIAAHLLGIAVGFLGPLIIWLVYRGRGPYLEDQAKEALNFQITVIIGYVAVSVLTVVTFGFGSILYLVVWGVQVLFEILAAVAAGRYEWYRYPVSIRFVK